MFSINNQELFSDASKEMLKNNVQESEKKKLPAFAAPPLHINM